MSRVEVWLNSVTALVVTALLFIAFAAMAWPGSGEPHIAIEDATPTPAAAPIVPPSSLDSLLAGEASAIRAPGVSPALGEPSAGPHLLMVDGPGVVTAASGDAGDARQSSPGSGFESRQGPNPPAALASCGPSCWGERLTRGDVEALALDVTGDAPWSAWAGRCFSRPGAESGGYPQAVGGPNADGSWDLGIAQMNTVHGAWADMERVLADPAYALRMAYRLHGQQGAGAWYGCDGGGE